MATNLDSGMLANMGRFFSGDQRGMEQYDPRRQTPTFMSQDTNGNYMANWMSTPSSEFYDPTNKRAYMQDGMGGYQGYDWEPGKYNDNVELNGLPFQKYNSQGQYTGDGTFSGFSKKWDTMNWAVPGAMMLGGMGATIAGMGAPAATGAGVQVGGPMSTGLPAGTALGPAAGGAAAGGGAGGLGGGIASTLAKIGGAVAPSLFGGGGGVPPNPFVGGNGGGMGLNDLIGLIGGGLDASRQGQAADRMLNWLNTNQSKMDSYMQPDSPEWNAMWEQMSRKDAAAGRNSQYGPRTADFLAKVASEKAANTRQFTTGTSRAYADALDQNAGKYAGLSAAAQRMATGGSPINLSSIIGALTGNNTIDNQTFFDMVGDAGMPIDYGNGMPDPTEDDVWDFINGGDLGQFF